MAQEHVPISDKNPKDKYFSSEFNTQKSTIDANADDTEARLVPLEGATVNKLDKVDLTAQTVAGPIEFLQEITVPPASIVLGLDGAKLSSSGRAFLFRDVFRTDCFYPFYVIEDSGNINPQWPSPGDGIMATVNPDFGATLSDPQEMAFPTSQGNTFTKSFVVRPKTSGVLTVEVWTGTNDSGAVMVKNNFTINPIDVGTEVSLMLPNPLMLFFGDSIFTRFSGVQLDGEAQTAGPFVGQVKPFLKSFIHILEMKSLVADGDVVFGKEYQDDESEAESTTASTSFVNKLSMVTPITPAGRYLVSWHFSLANSTKDMTSQAQITVDGSPIEDCDYTPSKNNAYICLSGFKAIDLTEIAHTLEIDYRAVASTAKIKSARLMLYRVS